MPPNLQRLAALEESVPQSAVEHCLNLIPIIILAVTESFLSSPQKSQGGGVGEEKANWKGSKKVLHFNLPCFRLVWLAVFTSLQPKQGRGRCKDLANLLLSFLGKRKGNQGLKQITWALEEDRKIQSCQLHLPCFEGNHPILPIHSPYAKIVHIQGHLMSKNCRRVSHLLHPKPSF